MIMEKFRYRTEKEKAFDMLIDAIIRADYQSFEAQINIKGIDLFRCPNSCYTATPMAYCMQFEQLEMANKLIELTGLDKHDFDEMLKASCVLQRHRSARWMLDLPVQYKDLKKCIDLLSAVHRYHPLDDDKALIKDMQNMLTSSHS